MTHVYGYLARQAEEDALHAERLLFIEERPFTRVTKRLTGEESFLRYTPKQLPSPPPEGEETEVAAEQAEKPTINHQKFREDVLNDFAALESSITRIQLIQLSNARERERYAAEKIKIQASAQTVRDNTIHLREQLQEAQKILQLRKGYDELASKILDNRSLKSREEATAEIATLQREIEELQTEGQEIEGLWDVRKEAFERVVEEGKIFIRVIKGIKDQPENEEDADTDMDGEGIDVSNVGTPRPEGGQTPLISNGGTTPMPDADEVDDVPSQAPSRLREVDLAESITQGSDLDMLGSDGAVVTSDADGEVPADSAEAMDET